MRRAQRLPVIVERARRRRCENRGIGRMSYRAGAAGLAPSQLKAYRASGLAAIPPYDRGSGRTTDLASDLRRASQSTPLFEKYMSAFHAVLLGYPQASVPGMRQDFRWVSYNIESKPT
jgi:hypothetical protein